MRPAVLVLTVLSLVALVPAMAQDRGLAVVAREVTGQADFDVGRQVAVIIGIDRYKEWTPLRSAVAEAKKVKAVLAERYYIDEFVELYDEAANAEGIRRLFAQDLPKKLGIRDSLLVFYAGHGYLDASKTGFWIASDGAKNEFSQAGWIPNVHLRNYLGQLKAQRVLVLADSCFSGDFLNVHRGSAPVVDSAYYKKALQLTARQALTSGASESVPDESDFGAQLVNLLERNTEKLLDPYAMFDRIKLGMTKALPLMGSLPGNEMGASFMLFLKPQATPGDTASSARANASAGAQVTPPVQAPVEEPVVVVSRSYGNLVVTAASGGKMAVIRPSVVCRVEWIVVPTLAGDGIAVIQDSSEIRGIIACLAGRGVTPIGERKYTISPCRREARSRFVW